MTLCGLTVQSYKCDSSHKFEKFCSKSSKFPWREHHITTIHSNCHTSLQKEFITTHKRRLGQGNVFTPGCLSMGVWCYFLSGCFVLCSLGGWRGMWWRGWKTSPSPRTGDKQPQVMTSKGNHWSSGMHPTGMHSCWIQWIHWHIFKTGKADCVV